MHRSRAFIVYKLFHYFSESAGQIHCLLRCIGAGRRYVKNPAPYNGEGLLDKGVAKNIYNFEKFIKNKKPM